jgi:hypothetical protein
VLFEVLPLLRSAVLALAVTAAPATPVPTSSAAPSPAPQPSATPLQEIGHVKATVCVPIIGHSNGAISHVFHNDHTLVATINSFRSLDFSDAQARSSSIRDLLALATSLREETAKGRGELRSLQTLEPLIADPAQKQGVIAFVSTLNVILSRQVSEARQIDGFLQFYGYDDPSAALAEDDAPLAVPTPVGAGVSQTGTLPHNSEMHAPSVITTSMPMSLSNVPFDTNSPELMAQEHADDAIKLGTQINDQETEAAKDAKGVMSSC